MSKKISNPCDGKWRKYLLSIAFYSVIIMKNAVILAIVLLLGTVSTVLGQAKTYTVGQPIVHSKKIEDPKLALSVTPKNIKWKAGKIVKLKLTIKIPKKWHLYGTELQENKDGIGPQPTEITLKDSMPTLTLGAITPPKMHVEYDEGFEMDVKTIEGTVTIELPITVSSEAAAGKYSSAVAVYFQMCDGKTCLTPHEQTVPFEFEIVP